MSKKILLRFLIISLLFSSGFFVFPQNTEAQEAPAGQHWERQWVLSDSSSNGQYQSYRMELVLVADDACFPAGTKITMADGAEKNIEDVEIGDFVLAYDEESGEKKSAKVLEIESPMAEGYYALNDDLLRVTDEHPIYTRKKDGTVGWGSILPEKTKELLRWRSILSLEAGDSVFTQDNEWVELTSIEYIEGEIQTYNLKVVEPYQTFFADGVLVHNKPPEKEEVGGGNSETNSYTFGTEQSGLAIEVTSKSKVIAKPFAVCIPLPEIPGAVSYEWRIFADGQEVPRFQFPSTPFSQNTDEPIGCITIGYGAGGAIELGKPWSHTLYNNTTFSYDIRPLNVDGAPLFPFYNNGWLPREITSIPPHALPLTLKRLDWSGVFTAPPSTVEYALVIRENLNDIISFNPSTAYTFRNILANETSAKVWEEKEGWYYWGLDALDAYGDVLGVPAPSTTYASGLTWNFGPPTSINGHFFYIPPEPGQEPGYRASGAGSETQRTPYLQWNRIPGAVKYQLQILNEEYWTEYPGVAGYAGNFTYIDFNPDTSPTANEKFITLPDQAYNNDPYYGYGTWASGTLIRYAPPQYQIPVKYPQASRAYYWRVRGIDGDGNVVGTRPMSYNGGSVYFEQPVFEYKNVGVLWNRDPNAKYDIVDLVQNPADFDLLPTAPGDPILPGKGTKDQQILMNEKKKSFFGSLLAKISQIAHAQGGGGNDGDMPFLIRKVIVGTPTSEEVVAKNLAKLMRDAVINYGHLMFFDIVIDGGKELHQFFIDYCDNDPNVVGEFEYDTLCHPDGVYGWAIKVCEMDYPGVSQWREFENCLWPKVINGQIIVTGNVITVNHPSSSFNVIDASTGSANIVINELNSTTTTLTLTGNQGQFILEFPSLADFKIISPSVDLGGQIYYEFENLLPDTKYYWRVKSAGEGPPTNGGGNLITSHWTAIASFTTPPTNPIFFEEPELELVAPVSLKGKEPFFKESGFSNFIGRIKFRLDTLFQGKTEAQEKEKRRKEEKKVDMVMRKMDELRKEMRENVR